MKTTDILLFVGSPFAVETAIVLAGLRLLLRSFDWRFWFWATTASAVPLAFTVLVCVTA